MQQAACFYRRSLGETLVTTLSDGYLDGSTDIVQGITRERKSEIMRGTFRDLSPLRLALNGFLVQRNDRLALVDAGGAAMNPGTGKLLGRLRAAGHTPDEIDTVLISHLHPDHILGLVNSEGKPAYPKARIHVHEVEHAHWHSDAAKEACPEPFRMFFDMARTICAAYPGRVETFSGGEVFPGVTSVALPGHTPGHSGYQVNDSENLLIWGDIFHVPELQVRHPECSIVFDVNPELAVRTRRDTLARAAAERLLVAGMHLNFPAFAHVAQEADGFALVPEAWRDDP
jgi:glyoxylase-like metal-dependent hydrolase (beta-lactamase superfamily II)